MKTNENEYKPYNPSLKVFPELSLSEDKMAQMYAIGFEKKEIASLLSNAYSTVVNTISKVYEKLHVRNRSELSIQFAERKHDIHLSLDFSPKFRQVIASILLLLVITDIHQEIRQNRRVRNSRNKIELTAKIKSKVRSRNLPLII